MHLYRLNLTTTLGATDWIKIGPTVNKASISIKVGSSFTWAGATVDLQHTFSREFDEDGQAMEYAQNYSPAIQFDSDTTARRNISVSGSGYIRLLTTEAEALNDPDAQVVVLLS